MKLITEVLEDSVQYITEANEEGEKEYFIEGVFMQANKPNRNGRIYPTGILENEVKRYNKEYVMKNRAFGELGHPQGPTINLERVSHMIKELYQDGDNFMGRAKIMDSPYGTIVKNLIKEGASLGVSSRGMGSLKTKNGINEVQKDFYLATAADIVADPSAPDAFVEGIMEGVDWVMNNGKWVETFVEKSQHEIKKASKSQLESTKLRIFENFMKKI
tara:strand:- start:303 stop:953 length:651 start_codon:yes stop_codon:yes gene_type:complete